MADKAFTQVVFDVLIQDFEFSRGQAIIVTGERGNGSFLEGNRVIVTAVFWENFSFLLAEYICKFSSIFLRDEVEIRLRLRLSRLGRIWRQSGDIDLKDLDISLFEKGLEGDRIDHRHRRGGHNRGRLSSLKGFCLVNSIRFTGFPLYLAANDFPQVPWRENLPGSVTFISPFPLQGCLAKPEAQ